MAECLSQTARILTVVFNGVNYDPIDKTALIKIGGAIASESIMTVAGKSFHALKMEGGEVEFEIPWTKGFNPESLRGGCGDLQLLTDGEIAFLVENASLAIPLEFKGEGKIKVTFKGDVAKVN
jgi:hypothetical protein